MVRLSTLLFIVGFVLCSTFRTLHGAGTTRFWTTLSTTTTSPPNATSTSQYVWPVRLAYRGDYHRYDGRLEIYRDGQWGTVCDDNFDYHAATVVCRMLGYSGGHPDYIGNYGDGTGSILLDDVECTGHERELYDCFNYTTVSDCTHVEDVAVYCGHTPRYTFTPQLSPNLNLEGTVRLVNGPSRFSGRVEVYYKGEWGTVCDDGFDLYDAMVICRMLGMYQGRSYTRAFDWAHFGAGTGRIVIDHLQCSSSESDIAKCRSLPWLYHNCVHSEDAGVDCYAGASSPYPSEHYSSERPTTYVPGTSYGRTSVRLVNGPDRYSGRVEVYYGGRWGTICDDSFSQNDARVICRMLGMYNGYSRTTFHSNAYYGVGSGTIVIDELSCQGYESDIRQCRSNVWTSNDCSHSEDVGVDCLSDNSMTTDYPQFYHHETTETFTTAQGPTQIRLVNPYGNNYYSGRVEVFYRGRWGTICDDSFSHNDAIVICKMLGRYQGYSRTVARTNAAFGQGTGPIIIDDLKCNGYERDIKDCRSNVWMDHNCAHYEDAGVNCNGYYNEMTTDYYHHFHRETTVGPTSGYRLEDAIVVSCSEFGWNIQVDMNKIRQIYPNAKGSDIYMGDNSCTGFQVGAILTFQQGLRQCLTSETIGHSEILYNNELIYAEHDPIHTFIIRHYRWRVGVECDVQRNESASGHLHHDQGIPSGTHMVSGTSHYTVNMTFFSDPNFMYQLRGNPLHVPVGTPVYVKLFTTAADWTIKMRVHTCYTKPSPSAAEHLTYYIIKNGCEVDTNTHIISQSTHETKLVFENFEFSSNHEGLYLFCQSTFCASSDTSRACLQTCNPVVKRARIPTFNTTAPPNSDVTDSD